MKRTNLETPHWPVLTRVLLLAVAAAAIYAAPATAARYSAWSAPDKLDTVGGNAADINTPSVDGCPILSPDGLALYMASTRPRFAGDTRTDLDIWVATRESTAQGFGSPVNLGSTINSTANDFCPTPVRGKGLFFVSERAGCGAGDIYFARLQHDGAWTDPVNLGCDVNTAAGEAGPAYFEADGAAYLYFSSGPDIVASRQRADGSFAPATAVTELNSGAGDLRPNVRKDGLEIVFDSNRSVAGALGGFDLYFATRDSVNDPWGAPVNAGAPINTAANETRGSFSWDATTLLFGRAPGPEGMTDIYVSHRSR